MSLQKESLKHFVSRGCEVAHVVTHTNDFRKSATKIVDWDLFSLKDCEMSKNNIQNLIKQNFFRSNMEVAATSHARVQENEKDPLLYDNKT